MTGTFFFFASLWHSREQNVTCTRGLPGMELGYSRVRHVSVLGGGGGGCTNIRGTHVTGTSLYSGACLGAPAGAFSGFMVMVGIDLFTNTCLLSTIWRHRRQQAPQSTQKGGVRTRC